VIPALFELADIFSGGGVLELLQQIVNEPPPKLPEGPDYQGLDTLIERCLVKDPDQRPRPEELMVLSPFIPLLTLQKDPFVVAAPGKEVDLAKWAQGFVIQKKSG
jgi:mitogen-activated protein kinase kinase